MSSQTAAVVAGTTRIDCLAGTTRIDCFISEAAAVAGTTRTDRMRALSCFFLIECPSVLDKSSDAACKKLLLCVLGLLFWIVTHPSIVDRSSEAACESQHQPTKR